MRACMHTSTPVRTHARTRACVPACKVLPASTKIAVMVSCASKWRPSMEEKNATHKAHKLQVFRNTRSDQGAKPTQCAHFKACGALQDPGAEAQKSIFGVAFVSSISSHSLGLPTRQALKCARCVARRGHRQSWTSCVIDAVYASSSELRFFLPSRASISKRN